MKRRTVQPEIRSFVLLLRSPVTPFDSGARFTKNANCFEECNVFGNGTCELSDIQEAWEKRRCKFLLRISAKPSEDSKVHIFGKEKCKAHRQL